MHLSNRNRYLLLMNIKKDKQMVPILQNVFTKRNLENIYVYHHSNINEKALHKVGLIPSKINIAHDFDSLYQYLDQNYRDEYIFKNELLKQLVIKVGTNKVSALRELAIADCIADFAVCKANDTEIFEIKTGLDSLSRLFNQLNNYYQAFTKVSVVSTPQHIKQLKANLPISSIGLYILHKNDRLEQVKAPDFNSSMLNYETIFFILRAKEKENIIKACFGKLPHVGIYYYEDELLKMFKQLPILQAQQLLNKQLQLRLLGTYHQQPELLLDFPSSLYELIYFGNYSKRKAKKLQELILNGKNEVNELTYGYE